MEVGKISGEGPLETPGRTAAPASRSRLRTRSRLRSAALALALFLSVSAVLAATLAPDGAGRVVEFVKSFDTGILKATFATVRSMGIHAQQAAVIFHFLLFAVAGSVLGIMLLRRGVAWPQRLAIGMAAALVLATGTELAQDWVRGRSPSLIDWYADLAGAAWGLTIGSALLRWLTGLRP